MSEYQRVISQRNGLLRSGKERNIEFEPRDDVLVTLGTRIMKRRVETFQDLQYYTRAYQMRISGREEYVKLRYQPSVRLNAQHD